jgi:hypothetical protein
VRGLVFTSLSIRSETAGGQIETVMFSRNARHGIHQIVAFSPEFICCSNTGEISIHPMSRGVVGSAGIRSAHRLIRATSFRLHKFDQTHIEEVDERDPAPPESDSRTNLAGQHPAIRSRLLDLPVQIVSFETQVL